MTADGNAGRERPKRRLTHEPYEQGGILREDCPGASEIVRLRSDDVECLEVDGVLLELGRAGWLLEPEQGDLDAGRHGWMDGQRLMAM